MHLDMPADHGDDSPQILTKDQQAIAIDACNELIAGFADLRKYIIEGRLAVCNRFNILSIMENQLKRLIIAAGHGDAEQKEVDLCHKQIRDLNQELTDLREQLGKATPLDGLGDRLYALDHQVNEHWKSLGFGLVEGNFEARWYNSSRYMVKLSCYISEDYLGNRVSRMFSDTPHTDAEKAKLAIEELKKHIDLHSVDRYDLRFLDTPKNRAFVLSKMREKFPSFRVFEWEVRTFHHELPDQFYIAYIQGSIDLKDFKDGNTANDEQIPQQTPATPAGSNRPKSRSRRLGKG